MNLDENWVIFQTGIYRFFDFTRVNHAGWISKITPGKRK